MGLYVQLHARNITGSEVVDFLCQLRVILRGRIVLLWDGGPIHRRADVRDYLFAHRKRLYVFRFPAYSPELNPDEHVWTQTKNELSNSTPQSIDELGKLLCRSLRRLGRSQKLLRSCMKASDLPY